MGGQKYDKASTLKMIMVKICVVGIWVFTIKFYKLCYIIEDILNKILEGNINNVNQFMSNTNKYSKSGKGQTP